MSSRLEGRAYVMAQVCVIALLAIDAWRGLRCSLGARVAIGAVIGATGGAVLVAGASRLGAELRAEPEPSAGAVLRTDGAYARVRHPIYAGLLLGAAGLVLTSGRVRSAGLLAALLAILSRKMDLEERLLIERFPGYAAYAARTPRLVPRVLRFW